MFSGGHIALAEGDHFVWYLHYILLQAKITSENKTTLQLDSNIWTILITISFFIVFGIVDRRLYKRRNEISHKVRGDIKSKLDNFAAANISIATSGAGQ